MPVSFISSDAMSPRRRSRPKRANASRASSVLPLTWQGHPCSWAGRWPNEVTAKRGLLRSARGWLLRPRARAGWRVHFHALLAETYSRVGKVEEGLAALAEALRVVEETGIGFCEPELHRLQGELLMARAPANPADAEACFRQAIDIARRQDAKSLELRAILSLSRLYLRQGRRVEARPMLAEIYGWFTEGFDTADLQEAKALLEVIS